MKTLIFACLATLLLASCAKENEPQPADPAPETTVSRSMSYTTASSHDNSVTYNQATIQSAGQLDDTGLQLSWMSVGGNDDISFTIPKAALTTDLRGTYALQTLANSNGTAKPAYRYYRSNVPGSLHWSTYGSAHTTQGRLIITAYNNDLKLISGTFEVQLNDLEDPTDDTISNPDKLRCDVKVVGSFANLKLQ